MPSKQKVKPVHKEEESHSEEDEQSYDLEDDDMEIVDDSQIDSGDDASDDGDIREVDKANLLNYQSDDSEDVEGMDDDDESFDNKIKKQKEDLLANDTWGRQKKNFYGRDKKRDVPLLSTSLTYIIGCFLQ